MSNAKLTGKQAAFVNAYLGEARFNATVAAKIAGYRANSKHSFEAIGSENLTRPGIRAAIDQHFKLSRMSAEEVLIELTTLARGQSKDKIKALALLSQHHSLLDGKWQDRDKTPLEIQVRYVQPELDKREREVNEWMAGIEKEINELNDKGLKIYDEAKAKFADSAEVAEFCKYYEQLLGGKAWGDSNIDTNTPTEKPLEVEIIPPQRRLEPAPAERLMQDVIEVKPEPKPELCRHGYELGKCNVIQVGYDCPHYYNRNERKYRYA